MSQRMIPTVLPMPTECAGLEQLTNKAFRRYIETGDWGRESRESALAERALERASNRWHALRAALGQALARDDNTDRPVALAEIALAEYEELQDWHLVRRLLERFRIGAEGCGRRSIALDGTHVGQAISLARSWRHQTPRNRT